MILKILLSTTLLLNISLFASFEEGKKIFENRCSSCHGDFVSIANLKINFYEHDNKLLKIDIPTENMLVYAIMHSSKKIGDPEDPEMREIEIEEYLKSYLKKPDLNNSICEPTLIKYYKVKKPMEISDKEAVNLTHYFMGYDEYRKKHMPQKKKNLKDAIEDNDILKEANDKNRQIIIYATSKTCYFCKKMKKEVLSLEEIKTFQNKNFLFYEVEVDDRKLPFNLNEEFNKITPTFFFLDKKGKLKNIYPGSWNKSDYIEILKENIN